MSQKDETREPMTNMERLREQASACGPGCDCNARPWARARWVVGAIIVVIAVVLTVRAIRKGDSSQIYRPEAEFALSQTSTAQQTTADPSSPTPEGKTAVVETVVTPEVDVNKPDDKPVICGELIQSLSDLNSKAIDNDGVFVFLAGEDAVKNREIVAVIEKSASTLRGRNISMGVFTLKDGSSEYANLARQVAPPCVLAMAKGRGASAVTDDVTESKLIQAFVAASSAGGCGPSGCGPSGCK